MSGHSLSHCCKRAYGQCGLRQRTSMARKIRATSAGPPALLDLILLDRKAGLPQYQQLYRQMRDLILQRSLRPGTSLPSTRGLAGDLGIARNTVIAVYEQLEAEGFIETRHGARARVSELPLDPM